MPDRVTHLFFYGVLLGDVAPPAVKALLADLGPGRKGTVQGMLYAVPDPEGSYPVLIKGTARVHGMVHEARGVDMAALDLFEGIDPHDPANSEYRRIVMEAVLEDGSTMMSQAYFYNREIGDHLVPLEHGDFTRYLLETGFRPYSGE
ncbi:gamma-glutamylcyclotransferase family protein [Altericroceibacterium spongiae]|uniref:gamma-glutamylcyclotransferase family protein n=1 Tax=Altericroceibacterium spongiae TaxID=2320269 RepID=UPI0016015CDB|nr:gamma-glutamylcyclotransferase family protein [Altericroceibacterium spongiae]